MFQLIKMFAGDVDVDAVDVAAGIETESFDKKRYVN